MQSSKCHSCAQKDPSSLQSVTSVHRNDFLSLAAIVLTTNKIIPQQIAISNLEVSSLFLTGCRGGSDGGRVVTFGGCFGALAKCAVAGVLALAFRLLDRGRSFRMRQKLALNTGKLRAVFNLPLAELYRKPD